MKERALDVLRFVVISPELFAVLACLAVRVYLPGIFEAVGRAVGQEAGIAFPLCLAMWALTGYSVKLAKDLLAPTDEGAKVLAKWPDYAKLRNRAMATILICAACALVIGAAMLLRASIPPLPLGLLIVICVAEGLISTATLLNATFQVRYLIDSEQP